MTLLALLLIVASAALHATWNYWGKKRQPSVGFFWIANLASLGALLPFALFHLDTFLRLPREVWQLGIASGGCLAIYFGALATSYRLGELSVAYPLARSSPILVVMATTALLGRGDEVGWGCAAGSVLIVAGCIFVPLEKLSDLSWRCFVCASCGFAFVAACGTAGYSILDDEALRLWRAWGEVESGGDSARSVFLYATIQAAACAVWLSIPLIDRKEERRVLVEVWRTKRRAAIAAGVVIVLTYSLVLGAMEFVENVSYVVAFRQLSIPIGVAMGAFLLKEKVAPVRWVGVALLVAGLVLVAVA